MSPPHALASPATTTAASSQNPTGRRVSGYSWRKPFLRRPPSTSVGSSEGYAKNEPHPRQSMKALAALLTHIG